MVVFVYIAARVASPGWSRSGAVSYVGDGPKNTRSSLGSYEPGTHIEPPVRFSHGIPFQLSPPGWPGFGMFWNLHASLPVTASNATMTPPPGARPLVPTMTFPLATSGPP